MLIVFLLTLLLLRSLLFALFFFLSHLRILSLPSLRSLYKYSKIKYIYDTLWIIRNIWLDGNPFLIRNTRRTGCSSLYSRVRFGGCKLLRWISKKLLRLLMNSKKKTSCSFSIFLGTVWQQLDCSFWFNWWWIRENCFATRWIS